MNRIKKIFQKINGYEADIFQPVLSDRIILICLGILTRDQYEALKKTAAEFGENYFYSLSNAKGINVNDVVPKEEKRMNFDAYSDYNQHYLKDIFSESISYSSSGMWGIIFSDDAFAIIAGKPNFMNAFKKNYPLYREHMMIFDLNTKLENYGWIKNLMKNFPKDSELSSEESKKYWRKAVAENIQNIALEKDLNTQWKILSEKHFDELFLWENASTQSGTDFWISKDYLTQEEGEILKPFNKKLSELWEIYDPKDSKWKLKWNEIRKMAKEILEKIDFDKLPKLPQK